MKNIALGQYYPAQSPIHRLDARIKVILAILYIVCTFLCKSALGFAVLALSAILLILLSRVPLRTVFRAIRPILFIMMFTAVFNLFLTRGEGDPLWAWTVTPKWTMQIFEEGIYSAVFMVIRIVVLILGTSIFLTYTTTPIALTDAIESLLSPLRIIRLPVHEFAMMMSIALRFIPTLMEETTKIMNAQKARGVDFAHGSLIKRAKALVPILIPLFVSSFRRADELATAMECRCYRGGKGRTKMRVPHLRFGDFLSVFLMLAFGTGLVLLNYYGFGYRM
ncbi:MAG: energy-coupling factor transporter transmembrane protein EcfT [Ruminococcaceae bacterium]|nr:energy-coupling factor transporter transmembrane protein EcfT [Oscillospiraceae bacterium]